MPQKNKYYHVDITNERFGRLVAIEKVGRSTWLMHCDCGNDVILRYSRLLYGQRSCGCLRKEIAQEWAASHTKHGKSKTKIYRKYRSILNRCYNQNSHHYDRYGGRGITVCEEWRNSFDAFYKWAYDNGYDEKKNGSNWSIDRIDNGKGYSPNNCRFTTAKEQMRNRDITVLYEYNGKSYSASEFADEFGITDKSFVYKRAKQGETLGEILDAWNMAHDIPYGYVDTATYAEKCKVTTTTVNRWINSGKVQAEKRGRKWYIKE